MKLENLELSSVVKNKDGKTQTKKCLFLSAKMTMRVQDIVDKDKDGEDLEITIPCMCVENEQYDADQDQEKEMFLPLSSDLVLLKYRDSAEKKTGYVFFYPSQDKTWLIESDDTNAYINKG